MPGLQKFYFIENFNKDHLKSLDSNTNVIYRNYKEKYDVSKIFNIKKFCKKIQRKFFLANDINLAVKLQLDGVYIPSFVKTNNFNFPSKPKDFSIIGSAHNKVEIKIKENQGCNLIFLAPTFKVAKKNNYLGVNKFNLLTLNNKSNFIALGGVNKNNINKLKLLNCEGFSGISWIKKNSLKKFRPFLNNLNGNN